MVLFFLDAVITTAIKAKANLVKMIDVKKKYGQRIYQSKIRGKYQKALKLLFANPVMTVNTLAKSLQIDYQ